MRYLLLSILSFYSILIWGQHSAYNINDTLHVWKHDGIEILDSSNSQGKVLFKIGFGEKVTVIEEINHYWGPKRSHQYKDTLFVKPLLIVFSYYIKVNYKGFTGYVVEKYLDKKSPYDIYDWENLNPIYIVEVDNHGWIAGRGVRSKLCGDHLLYSNISVSPGQNSDSYEIKEVYNNGVIINQSGDGSGIRSRTTLPFINKNNYILILYKCFVNQEKEPRDNFYYELLDDVYIIGYKDRGEVNGMEGSSGVSYSFNKHGMIIISYDSGGC